jgi:hypothetical protein
MADDEGRQVALPRCIHHECWHALDATDQWFDILPRKGEVDMSGEWVRQVQMSE